MINRHAHILALMSISVASFGLAAGSVVRTTLIMAGLLAAAAVATILYERKLAATPARHGGAQTVQGQLVTTKRILMLMLAIGIVAYGGGAGTFSSFSAETSNNSSAVGSGTLTMSDSVNSATACVSNAGSSADNVNGSFKSAPASDANACDTALTLTNLAPGVNGGNTLGGYSNITIANTGSLDASKLWVMGSYVNTVLTSPVSAGAVTTLSVYPVQGPITSGDTIELDYGGNSVTLTANGATNPLKTSIAVTGTTTQTWPVGTRVLDKTTSGSSKPTNCFDVRTAAPPTGFTGATSGTDLNFNGTESDATTHWIKDTGNPLTGPLCKSALFWLQERSTVAYQYTGTLNGTTTVSGLADTSLLTQGMTVTGTNIPANTTISSITNTTTIVLNNAATGSGSTTLTFGGTFNYCWWGPGSSSSTSTTNNGSGGCLVPLTAAFTTNTTVSNTPGTLSFQSSAGGVLNGNIKGGDTLLIKENGKATMTCTVTAGAANNRFLGVSAGGTSVPISGCSGGPVTYTTAAVITDDSIVNSPGNVNADTTDSLSNFDTSKGPTSKIELATLIGNNALMPTTGASMELKAHQSSPGMDVRNFYLGVYFPAASGTPQNQLQGLQSTFGLTWHLDQ